MSAPERHLLVLPWIDLQEPLVFGPVRLIPADRGLDARVPDEAARSAIKRRLAVFKDAHGHPVRTAAVCAHGEFDLRPLTDAERAAVHHAVDCCALAILGPEMRAALLEQPNVWNSGGGDRFDLVEFAYDDDSDWIAFKSGRITHGGWTVDEAQERRPWHVAHGPMKPVAQVFDALAAALGAGELDDHRRRVLRALEWFRLSQTENPSMSPFVKVVQLATAFEALLDLGDDSKAFPLAEAVEARCGTAGLAGETRPLRTKAGKTKPRTFTPLGWWAVEFYWLRNKIVHGGALTADDRLHLVPSGIRLDQLYLGAAVFYRCVLAELQQLGQFAAPPAAEVDADEIPGGGADLKALTKAMDDHLDRERNRKLLDMSPLYRRFGWLPPA